MIPRNAASSLLRSRQLASRALSYAAASSAADTTQHVYRNVASPSVVLPKRTGSLINNDWVTTGTPFDTFNPATEEKIATCYAAGATEVNAAVDAARDAFYNPNSEWAQMGGYERGILLNRLANLMEQNAEELAMLETLDNGKPFGEAITLDLPLSVQCYRYYAGWADKFSGSVINPSGPVAKGTFGYMEKEPVGVVGQIIPWNFPLLMQAWKLGPALATGCSVVLKTAPQTPLSANRVGELILEAGFPKGAVNILPGDGATGELVATHEGIDKVAFTGSTAVGHHIMRVAADSNNLKRVTLELGGKSALIVAEDADMELAVGTAQLGLFLNQGQCCCASSRIFVHESRYNEFCEKIAAVASQKPVGPGYGPDHLELSGNGKGWPQGPQVSLDQMNKILDLIESGKQEGATLLAGGARHGDQGHFIKPTVFADVRDDMRIAKEEIFGPVMSIMPYVNTEEVIARANNSEFGLGASIISGDFNHARNIAKQLRSGTVWINCYDTFDAALPFGGFKASGIGRELGEAGLEPYIEKKTMVVGTSGFN